MLPIEKIIPKPERVEAMDAAFVAKAISPIVITNFYRRRYSIFINREG